MLHKLLAFALLIPAATPQPVPADFTICTIVNNGPLGPPQKRINGTAPVSPLA